MHFAAVEGEDGLVLPSADTTAVHGRQPGRSMGLVANRSGALAVS